MTTRNLFLYTFGVVAFIMCVVGVASIVALKQTIIVIEFEEKPDQQDIDITLEVLRARIKALGSPLNIRAGKAEYIEPRIIVTLRAYSDVSAFAENLLIKGEIKLHLAADEETLAEMETSGNVPDGYRLMTIPEEMIRISNRKETEVVHKPILLKSVPEMVIHRPKTTHYNLITIFRRPEITIEFDEKDGAEFAELTRMHRGRTMAVVIEDEVLVAAEIEDEITGGIVQIRYIGNHDRAQKLNDLIRIGSLPKPLKVVKIQAPS